MGYLIFNSNEIYILSILGSIVYNTAVNPVNRVNKDKSTVMPFQFCFRRIEEEMLHNPTFFRSTLDFDSYNITSIYFIYFTL